MAGASLLTIYEFNFLSTTNMITDLEAGIHRMLNTVQLRFDLSRIDRAACELFVRSIKKGSPDEASKVLLLDRLRNANVCIDSCVPIMGSCAQDGGCA